MRRWRAYGTIGLFLSLQLGMAAAEDENSATRFDCIIEPARIVKLASPMVGLIASIEVERGDIVRKGQIVARMENAMETVNLELAREQTTNDFAIKAQRARLDFLRNKLDRTDKLLQRADVSRATFEEAQADMTQSDQQVREAEHDLRVAQIELKRAQAALELRIVRSPIDGVVVERLLQPGEYRNEQAALMVLAQVDPLRVEVLVPTAYVGRISVGGKAVVRPEEPLGGEHLAEVTVVDRVIDSASGLFGVRLALPNAAAQLPAGLRCTMSFAAKLSASAEALN